MKKILLYLLFSVLLLINIDSVNAHCPLCTGAVGVAAVSAKYIGMDVSIIGLFIGAFGISTGLWFGKKIKKRFIRFQLPIIAILSFLLTVIPLRFISNENIFLPILYFGEYGSMFNKVYIIDKIILGSFIGGLVTLFAFKLHNYVKNINGKVIFPYQGVIFSLAMLGISSALLFFIFR